MPGKKKSRVKDAGDSGNDRGVESDNPGEGGLTVLLEEEEDSSMESRLASNVMGDSSGLVRNKRPARGRESSPLRDTTRRVGSPVREGASTRGRTESEDDEESDEENEDEGGFNLGDIGAGDVSNKDLMMGMMSIMNKLCKSQLKVNKVTCRAENWTGGNLVSSIAMYKEGTDVNKYMRGLEVELKELGVEKKRWKSVLLSKLPVKTKETVLDVIEEVGCTYSRLKEALIGRVGYRLRNLEVKLLNELDRETRGMDRLERFKHISRLVDRVLMMCGTIDKVNLFLIKGFFAASCQPWSRVWYMQLRSRK